MISGQSAATFGPRRHHVLDAARHYLGNRWVLLAVLGGLAAGAGLYFGGWGWLVAIGAAPIILSTLPCIVMCGLGICMACRSNKAQSGTLQDPAGESSSASLAVARMDRPSVGAPICCEGGAVETQAQQAKQVEIAD
jgi:hypothetical protein